MYNLKARKGLSLLINKQKTMQKQKTRDLPKFIMTMTIILFLGTLFGVVGYYLTMDGKVADNQSKTQQADLEKSSDNKISNNSEDNNIENNIDISDFKFIDEDKSDFSCGDSTVKDIDGNIYNTVKIGEQCWMKENLKVTKNPQGEKIIRYCYDNDENVCETDGGLYDWDTTMNNSTEEGAQGICPDGWHVPKDSEWHILENGLAVGGCLSDRFGASCDMAGTKLKIGGVSGFNGTLAGGRTPVSSVKGSHNIHNFGGDYFNRDENIFLWSSSGGMPYPGDKNMDPISIYHSISAFKSSIERGRISVRFSYSLRCLKN